MFDLTDEDRKKVTMVDTKREKGQIKRFLFNFKNVQATFLLIEWSVSYFCGDFSLASNIVRIAIKTFS